MGETAGIGSGGGSQNHPGKNRFARLRCAAPTAQWSSNLAADWIAADVGAAGVPLIDGHTRVLAHIGTPVC